MFLSHTTRDHRDHTLAHELAKGLEACGANVWIAPNTIPAGADWREEIVAGVMDKCSHFLVILSSASTKSEWVLNEINLAHQRCDEKPDFVVLPLIVGELEEFPNKDFIDKLQRIPYQNNLERQLDEVCKSIGILGFAEKQMESARSALSMYHTNQCATFQGEVWPYVVDRKLFVECVDFRCGQITGDRVESSAHSCIEPIRERIHCEPVVCVAYYGMGKTTIAKTVFEEWECNGSDTTPVFLSLAGDNISRYSANTIDDVVFDAVHSTLTRGPNVSQESQTNLECLRQVVSRMLDEAKIALIIDGLDEATCDRAQLESFLGFLKKTTCPILLTCRLEFRPFFDVFGIVRDWDHFCVELMPWRESQWNSYLSGMRTAFPNKLESIEEFGRHVSDGVFKELPSRPLFLKMLGDLTVNNSTSIQLSPELRSNRAEIYKKFLQWKIVDDYDRKGGKNLVDRELFVEESFKLFQKMAQREHARQFPLDVPVVEEDDASRDIYSETSAGNSIKDILQLCHDEQFVVLADEIIRSILLESSLFATLRRIGATGFTFSHRSFLEYLVAFDLAENIFISEPSDATCSESWRRYQTHEISEHFQAEVTRICITRGFDEQCRNEFLASAFDKVLAKLNTEARVSGDRSYAEDIEEVMFYAGTFPITAPTIVSKLKHVFENRDLYHPIYYRTAALSLSAIESSPSYCQSYVLSLLESARGDDREDFELNNRIQINYYGEGMIHERLGPHIHGYIADGDLGNIRPLRIYTFFVSAPAATDEEKSEHSNFMNSLIGAAKRFGHRKMLDILNGIRDIVEITN